MTLQELSVATYLFRKFSKEDKDYLKIANIQLEFSNSAHQEVVLTFLRKWGCRQFKKEDQAISTRSLQEWYEKHSISLPEHDQKLIDLTDSVIVSFAAMFNDLQVRQACSKKYSEKEGTSSIGPVGASKVLFSLRKHVFAPWDGPIRKRFRLSNDGKGYCKYLLQIKQDLLELQQTCIAFGISLQELLLKLNRPHTSLPKLIDEYMWVSVTRGCVPQEIINVATQNIF